jgi:pimeloyl-ACP methyl ester carboxylesterase
VWSAETGDPAAPLVVLVHGSMDRSSSLLRLARRLDDRVRVLRYDRRGYGKSLHPQEGGIWPSFAVEDHVADLLAVMGGRPAIVVGHSFGGDVALAAATTAPQLVRGVAVYEPPVSWEPWWRGVSAGWPLDRVEPAGVAERFMRDLVGDAVWEGLPERTRLIRRAEGDALVGELTALRRGCPFVAADVRCPVVVAMGERADPHHRDGAVHIHGLLPGSDLVVVPGAGHDGPHRRPDSVTELVVGPLADRVGEPWRAALRAGAAS